MIRCLKNFIAFLLPVQELLLLLTGMAWPEYCMDEQVWSHCLSMLIAQVWDQTLLSTESKYTCDEVIKHTCIPP